MAAPLLFTPLELRGVTLKNRVVVAPMHQYAALRGFATDWHLMNAGRYAAGGAGFVMMESTKVERRGCGTLGDLGLWDDAHIPGLARCVRFIRQHRAVPGIQLGHSGRKARRFRPWEGGAPLTRQAVVEALDEAEWEAWELVAPSALASPESDPMPRALAHAEIAGLVERWGQAARRAHEAGFEILEIHGAHGYLLHQFLSPFSNRRNDEYGGSDLNRMRFAVEVVESVRAHWPAEKPLFLRLSVEDDVGWGPAQSVELARLVKHKGVDVIDCSSGGMSGAPITSAGPITYGYQVPYAERIRREAGIMTMAVGLIVHADHAESILQEGKADLIALARELLYNPNWPMDAAQKLGGDPTFAMVPPPQAYWLEKRARQVKALEPSTYRQRLGA
ncbi:NADH:flavin oxidoreductase/NADH oxidase [Paracraurococcus lichenis]|uniref:NADH:flavin oxidoreductase/NADH oxidase n=1 Tax=Paracraurococcus lichenis TaxID=3064888 RepID=A0ABT9E9Y2_9PROT|nr:NADH:flavin oxidoreductase/NADH oxidase [Paracraurococcus sp. LOR1-02]MDO9712966.1 NADH:flavin oxidoreductase/NADH oxidase [Paracraurococcus sp. LOR1-02]